PSGRLAGPDEQTVIDRAVEASGIAKRIGVLAPQVSHPLDNVNTLRRIQNLVEDSGALQPEIHQGEIDIVIAASPGLQRISRILLFFKTGAHLRQLLAGAATLSVA